MSKNKRKRYDQEFKAGALMLVQEKGRSVPSVAADLGISEQTLYRWLNQSKNHGDSDKKRIAELEAQIRAANRRVADLEETVTILKKAAAIFVTPRK